jgi:hypothetical protein
MPTGVRRVSLAGHLFGVCAGRGRCLFTAVGRWDKRDAGGRLIHFAIDRGIKWDALFCLRGAWR